MRVLLLTETYHPEVGGGETQAALLGRELTRRGHAVTVLTRRSRSGLDRDELIDGVRVVRAGPSGAGRRRKWGFTATGFRELLRLRGSYDVVLVAGFRMLGLAALAARSFSRRPTVLKADSCGEMSGEFFNPGLARLGLSAESAIVRPAIAARNAWYRRADAFVAISGEIAAELGRAGIRAGRVSMIPNGVDTVAFAPATPTQRRCARDRLGLPDVPTVAFTGRLVTYKGLRVLLEAWRLVVGQRDAAANLLLIGESGHDIHGCERELRAYVDQHGLASSVRFTGAVSDVAQWLQASDVFAFPTQNEAFGLSLAEAMSCGLACVSTTVGGLRDFVVPCENALAVEPGEVAGLARAICKLLGDQALAARLGSAARRTAESRFSQEAVVDRYVSLFGSLIAGTDRASPK